MKLKLQSQILAVKIDNKMCECTLSARREEVALSPSQRNFYRSFRVYQDVGIGFRTIKTNVFTLGGYFLRISETV